MNTEQLIRVIAADQKQSVRVEQTLPLALTIAALAAGLVFLSGMGVRPDLAEALGHLNVVLKHAFPALLAIGAYVTALRLARPGAPLSAPALLSIALVPALLAAAVGFTLVTTPADAWSMAFHGKSAIVCLASVSLMGCTILAAALWALRRGASVHPALSGAAAGLLSGGVSASVYALYCNEDSPLFFAFWYVLAILLVTAVGSLLGARVLRW